MKRTTFFIVQLCIVVICLLELLSFNIYAVDNNYETLNYKKISDTIYMTNLINYLVQNDSISILDDNTVRIPLPPYETTPLDSTTSKVYSLVLVLKYIYLEENTLISTPNHTVPIDDAEIRVGVCIKEGTFGAEEDVMDYYYDDYIQEIKDDIAQNYARDCQEKGYTVVYLEPASIKYNCHSYAWYSQNSILNNVWLSSPAEYYSDYDSSYRALEPDEEPRIGDIIVYNLWNDTPNHSGIIVDYSEDSGSGYTGNANKYIVKSKWGDAGLYQHRGDHCSYYESATTIKYYRLRTDGATNIRSGIDSGNLDKPIISKESVENSIGTDNELSKEDTNIVYELMVTQSGISDIIIKSDYELDITVMDIWKNKYTFSTAVEHNDTYMYSLYGYLEEGIYYIRAEHTDEDKSGTVLIEVQPHMHNYQIHSDHSENLHKSECLCGASRYNSHVVKSSSNIGRYMPCAYCGRLIDTMGSSYFPIIKNIPTETEIQ